MLAYSGDTEWTDALIPIADGADLVHHGVLRLFARSPGHMSFTTLMAKRASLPRSRIMLTHMNPTMLARTDEARAEAFWSPTTGSWSKSDFLSRARTINSVLISAAR